MKSLFGSSLSRGRDLITITLFIVQAHLVELELAVLFPFTSISGEKQRERVREGWREGGREKMEDGERL